MLIMALPTGPPAVAVTVPLIVPVAPCEKAGELEHSTARVPHKIHEMPQRENFFSRLVLRRILRKSSLDLPNTPRKSPVPYEYPYKTVTW